MTIIYNPENKTAKHVESGLIVQYLREGPYVQEFDTYFRVSSHRNGAEFQAIWQPSYVKLKKKYPTMNVSDLNELMNKNPEINYYTSLCCIELNDLINTGKFSIEQIFVETWHRVAREINDKYFRVSVNYNPILSEKKWCVVDDGVLNDE